MLSNFGVFRIAQPFFKLTAQQPGFYYNTNTSAISDEGICVPYDFIFVQQLFKLGKFDFALNKFV